MVTQQSVNNTSNELCYTGHYRRYFRHCKSGIHRYNLQAIWSISMVIGTVFEDGMRLWD